MVRSQELEQQVEVIKLWMLESWPGIILDSTHGNVGSLQKLQFLQYMEEHPPAFAMFKAAVLFWMDSTKAIPKDNKDILAPINASMVNRQIALGGNYKMPRGPGPNTPKPGHLVPDLCLSPTNLLYHDAKLDSLVPPHLQPQSSMTSPRVAAKNRKALRKLSVQKNQAYTDVLKAAALREDGVKRFRAEEGTRKQSGIHVDGGLGLGKEDEEDEEKKVDYVFK